MNLLKNLLLNFRRLATSSNPAPAINTGAGF